MQSASWAALLQRIPPSQRENLMLVTNNGIEISIQSIYHVADEYLVLRGRLAGTDLGRVLFIPFINLTYLGFQKLVKEDEVRAFFGEGALPPVAPKPEQEPAAADAPEAAPAPEAATAAEAPQPAAAASAPRAPAPILDKKAMLERLRSRTSHQGTFKPPLNR